MPETVLFDVGMTCDGCAGACKRILGKMPGVSDVQADVAAKRVVVTVDGTAPSAASPQDMLEALQKWSLASGKEVGLASS